MKTLFTVLLLCASALGQFFPFPAGKVIVTVPGGAFIDPTNDFSTALSPFTSAGGGGCSRVSAAAEGISTAHGTYVAKCDPAGTGSGYLFYEYLNNPAKSTNGLYQSWWFLFAGVAGNTAGGGMKNYNSRSDTAWLQIAYADPDTDAGFNLGSDVNPNDTEWHSYDGWYNSGVALPDGQWYRLKTRYWINPANDHASVQCWLDTGSGLVLMFQVLDTTDTRWGSNGATDSIFAQLGVHWTDNVALRTNAKIYIADFQASLSDIP